MLCSHSTGDKASGIAYVAQIAIVSGNVSLTGCIGADTDSRAVLLLTPYSLLTRTCRDSDEPNGWRAPLRPDTQTHEHAHVHAAAAHVTSRL